jgi:lipoate-protein ligase A
MQLYNLGKVPWQDSQLAYHALAELGWESLVLVSPATPYVCIGYHQDAALEVDLDYCRENHIPVFRREVGGGAVFLDGQQLFFQLILPRTSPLVNLSVQTFYEKFLQPVIAVYRKIGVDAVYKPVNDLIYNGRKICGSGVGEIGEAVVFVGNLILDFNYRTMARVLKIPDEKYRDKIRKTIEENLTTIRRELGSEAFASLKEHELNRMLADAFAAVVGPLEPAVIGPELRAKMQEVADKMMNDDWLLKIKRKTDGRRVKIRSGLEMVHRMHKTVGGLLRAEFAIEDGRYRQVALSGDFFSFPKGVVKELSAAVEGCETAALPEVIQAFFSQHHPDQPGVKLEDWLTVLKS